MCILGESSSSFSLRIDAACNTSLEESMTETTLVSAGCGTSLDVLDAIVRFQFVAPGDVPATLTAVNIAFKRCS